MCPDCRGPNRTADGQYTFDKMDRLCTCGHKLGVHTAARAKNSDGVYEQPCMAADEPPYDVEHCDCDCFKPARKRR